MKITLEIEIEKIKQAFKNNNEAELSNQLKGEDNDWELPVYLEVYDLPEFPLNIFPAALKAQIKAVAEYTQTPVDFTALIGIWVLSTALYKNYQVEVRENWTEPVNVYAMPLMPPATRKTAILDMMTAPIRDNQSSLAEILEPQIPIRNYERKTLLKKIDELQKKTVKNNGPVIQDDVKILFKKLDETPEIIIPSLLVDDPQYDTVIKNLKDNDEKLAILSGDEILTSSNKNMKIDLLLKGYGKDPTDRFKAPSIALCITTYPQILEDLPVTYHRKGLTGRFLYSIPNDYNGYRQSNALAIPDYVQRHYHELLTKMLTFSAERPLSLHLDSTAQNVLIKMLEEVEKELRDETLSEEGFIHWLGKLVGNLIRIAGLLHVANHASTDIELNRIPTTINAETLSAAFSLKPYLVAHAKKAFGVMQHTEKFTDALFIIEKLLEENKPIIDRQVIWQKTKKIVTTAERLNGALDVLESRYYLRRITGGPSGRKEMIQLNHHLFPSAANS